jgi:hypothetical protein
MPVGRAISPFQQDAITAALEISSRGELTGPTQGLQDPQRELAASQNAVRAGGGTIASGPQTSSEPFNLSEPQQSLSRAHSAVRAQGGTIASGLQDPPEGSLDDQMAETAANLMAAIQIPERMFIRSADNLDEIVEAQFNPEKLKETIGIDWQKFRIPGLSHQRLQYGSANNLEYRFELIFDAAGGNSLRSAGGTYAGVAAARIQKNLDARNQLHAWMLRRSPEAMATLGNIGDTQRLLFCWPNLIELTCVPVSMEFEYTAFNRIGQPTAFKVEILVEEIRDAYMYAEDVKACGTRRGPGLHWVDA